MINNFKDLYSRVFVGGDFNNQFDREAFRRTNISNIPTARKRIQNRECW